MENGMKGLFIRKPIPKEALTCNIHTYCKVRNTLFFFRFVTKNGLPLNPSSGIPTEKE
jgi:hypothetical protein